MHTTRVIPKLKIHNGCRRRTFTAVKVAHSPDLSPSDLHFFIHLKKHLVSQKFHEDEEMKNEVTMWSHTQAAEFCDIGI